MLEEPVFSRIKQEICSLLAIDAFKKTGSPDRYIIANGLIFFVDESSDPTGKFSICIF